MSDPIWYRSLYFRIAFGFVALLATLLVVQGFVFLWMTGRMPELFPSRTPAQLAAVLAADTAALLNDPSVVDLGAEINQQYGSSFRGFVIALADGRTIESRRVPPPSQLGRAARSRLMATISRGGSGEPGRFRNGRGDRPWEGPRPPDGGRANSPPPEGRDRGAGFPRGGRGFGLRGGPPGLGIEFALVTLDTGTVGVVAVPIEPPPLAVTLQSLGPVLAIVAMVLLVAGTTIGALVIGGPTRRRLQQLQAAARALGAGQPGVRAPETGGDEVTALSHTFNEMASQLESRSRALEQADRTRRQLLADVSHELMTPLSAIRGYVETLGMTNLRLDEATRSRYLSIVTEEASRLEHIIGDLLDLARLEGGGGAFRTQDVSLDQLLARVRDRHGPAVAEKRITLETSLDPAVNQASGDANRLEQALQNLVANAIRHTPPGGRVAVAIKPDAGCLSIAVEDSGPGVPEEHLNRVFDRFYKVDESRTGTELPSGSGLGLSIVRAIVARHGGTVAVSNLPDAGARFEIRLPLSPSEGDPAA